MEGPDQRSHFYPHIPPAAGGVGGPSGHASAQAPAGPHMYQPEPAYPSTGPPQPSPPYSWGPGLQFSKPQFSPWLGAAGPGGTGVAPPDVEAQQLNTFADRVVRQGFMRKVFSIVAVQLALTVAFALVCFFVTPIKTYVQSTPWPFYMSWGLSFGLLLFISCNERARRQHPLNMILLGMFTLAEAFLVGMITSYFDIEVVALAFLTTCVAVAALAVIACQTKLDVTSWGTLLIVPGVVLIALVFLGVFMRSRILFLVISGAAALLASAYIVYDLQLIMGDRSRALSPDEYVMAALSLYLDIVQLFIWILYLIGFSRD